MSGSVKKISDDWYSGYSFERYCKQLSKYENCEFRTCKGKGGYWQVRLDGDIKGFPRSKKFFSLKLVKGKWIIDETWPHVPFELPEIDHTARESFASFIIEVVSPPVGHHELSLFDHRDGIEVRQENYERALRYCSARVNEAAAHAASLQEFFDLNLAFINEDVRSPSYIVNEDRPGEIRVVLHYFKPTTSEQPDFDYWTCLLVETADGWKCDFFVSSNKENSQDSASGERYAFQGGNGASRESAVAIEGTGPIGYPAAEEYWRAKHHPDWRIVNRVPIWDYGDTPKAYDDVEYLTADGKKQTVYFDISEPFFDRLTRKKSNSQPDIPLDH